MACYYVCSSECFFLMQSCFRAIDEGISKANKMAISRAATVQKWSIVPREFSVATGELSPSLKTKRFAVHEMYKKLIDEMYLHEGHTSVAW